MHLLVFKVGIIQLSSKLNTSLNSLHEVDWGLMYNKMMKKVKSGKLLIATRI